MTIKITISLEDSVAEFLDSQTSNRSGFINDLLKNIQLEQKNEALKAAYLDQEKDSEFWQEYELWDCTIGDGLTDASK